ncbi:MAG: TRAP transporter small permease subunit [Sulfitobacter sp.]
MSQNTVGRATMSGQMLRVLDKVSLAANVVGSCLIVGLVLMIAADVAGRNLLGAPVAGVPEMVSLSIVAIVFLQAPQALRAGRLTRSDGVIDVLKARAPRVAAGLETVFDLVGVVVLGVILYAHWPIMIRAWERNDFIGAVGNFTAPTWPVKGMLAIGAALLALQFAARIVRRFSA